jgi:EpsD family peptidyl-prolyl cis-trans isomerase
MRTSIVRLVMPVALVALLGGCDQIKKLTGGGAAAPKGQVVATVEGQEVTQAELQAELGGAVPANPQAAKAMQQAALQRIIARDLLAKAAHDQKLDQTPDFAVAMSRARKDLQVQLLEKKMAGEVPPPQRDEAERYVSDHPGMFAQRQLITLEQVQTPLTGDPNILKELSNTKDLASAEAVLDRHSAPHQRNITVVDTLRLNPRLSEQLLKLASDDVLIVNTPGAMTINKVKETRPQPLTGDQAVQLAGRLLAQQRTQDAVQKEAQSILASAKDKIKYNDAYKPTPVKAGPAPAAAPSAADASTPPGSVVPQAPASSTGTPYTLGK